MIGEVYFIRPVGRRGPIKIGHTTLMRLRLAGLNTLSPLELEVAATLPGSMDLERRFHAKFKPLRERGEWFSWSPALQETIDAINAGTFHAETLPLPECLPPRRRARAGGPSPRAERDLRLKADVLAFCSENDIPHSSFGRMANGDPALVRQLVQGRTPGLPVSTRVRSFMEKYPTSPCNTRASGVGR